MRIISLIFSFFNVPKKAEPANEPGRNIGFVYLLSHLIDILQSFLYESGIAHPKGLGGERIAGVC